MSKRARRIITTAVVLVFAALIVSAVIYGKTRQPAGTTSTSPAQQTSNVAQTQPATTGPAAATSPATAATTTPAVTATTAPQTSPSADLFAGLRAVAAGNDLGPRDQPPQPLGSLDPRRDHLEVRLSRFGAGIERIAFADIWDNAIAQRRARQYVEQLPKDAPLDLSQLPATERYILAARSPSKRKDEATGAWLYSQVPIMAARAAIINSNIVELANDDSWSETAPGEFQCRIVNSAGQDIALVTRRFSLRADYDIALEQRIRNLTDQPLQVHWQQYGPVDLPEDRTGYIPRRRLHFGYLPDPSAQPSLVLGNDKLVVERGSAIDQYEESLQIADPIAARQARLLWPNDTSKSRGYGMSWFATTNRYFGMAVHPAIRDTTAPASASLESSVLEIEAGVSGSGPDQTLYSVMFSPGVTLAPAAEHAFDLGVYAGPLDRQLLHQPPYDGLAMPGMIIYTMSGCCTWLTFQWLAHLLLWFLAFLHDYVVFDWGMAIIGLVMVVRTLLHPLTKKSQINMQRFGKQMQALKPEIDKLQKKFGSDPKRMQTEQMKLMREHGVNPLQMLGCLPMFLQMPIWIALWAMLYLAFDIRQQPAFYGIFQIFGDWPFLADLSSEDNFIPLGPGFTIPLVGWTVTAINLLPMLIGVVFYLQQKYMTPPPSPNMTAEQITQQKMMKWMMVLLFPLMMYKAPSGLTLYIMTSTIIGIMESRYVRRHIDQLDLTPVSAGGAGANAKPKKPKDSLGRAWAERLEAMRQRQQQRQQDRRSFKKRK